MSKGDARRQAIRDYKQRQVERGTFAIRCTATGEIWVGTSLDLSNAGNRERFFLRQGRHRDKALQECWNTHGEAALVFETLETLPDDVPEMAVRDGLKSSTVRWVAQLGARLLLP
jgi:hypothetical protein